ncbi:hypothetical protein [Aquabacter cavernae]|nr:hypothetical protein [Aquabacter cavernae]
MGLLNDKVRGQGDADNPLPLLIREVQGNAIRPVPTPMLEHEDCVWPVQ